ncbi:hypothetical protein ACOME3_010128 [Neoechinorhynchus agilis]
MKSSNQMLEERLLVEFLNSIVGRCDKITRQLLSCHDSFDRRLQALQDVAKPISNSTNRLQTIIQNSERTIVLLDNILQFYTVYDDLGAYISAGPTGDMMQYLRHLEQLQGSLDYFKRIAVHEKMTETELERVNNLLISGQRKLMSECEVLINKYSNTYQITDLDILLDGHDESLYQPRYTMNRNDILTLSTVFKWFAQQHFKYGPVNLYASTRGDMIKKSLEAYSKSLSDADNFSVLDLSSSSSMRTPRNRKPEVRISETLSSVRLKQDKLRNFVNYRRRNVSNNNFERLSIGGRSSQMSKTPPYTSPQPGSMSPSHHAVARIPDEKEAIHQCKAFATLVVLAFMLFEKEKRQITEVFPEDLVDEVFCAVTHKPLLYLQSSAENLCRLKEGLNFKFNQMTWAISLLHIVNAMLNLRPTFTNLFGTTYNNRQSQVFQLSRIFERAAVQALNDVAEAIKSDPKDERLLPFGGGVQQITFETLSFIETICNKYFDVTSIMSDGIYSLLKNEEDVQTSLIFENSKLGNVNDPEISVQLVANAESVNLSRYLVTLLKWLNTNILAKSDCYQSADTTIRSIYLLNNIQYILQILQGNLVDIFRLTRGDIEDQYNQDIEMYKNEYSNCYTKLVHVLQNLLEWHNNQHIPDSRLKEKDRDAIKEGFNTVNREINYLIEKHDTYMIHDIDLRKTLKEDAKIRIIPLYTKFYQTFTRKDFTKNQGKYILYSVEHLSHRIDNFFEKCS